MKLLGMNLFLHILVIHSIYIVQGKISVSCDFRKIRVLIEDMPSKLERFHSYGFYVGRDSRCYVDDSSLVVIRFPFRRCDTQATMYDKGVVYSNTIFMVKAGGAVEKYAEFQCQYGTVAGDVTEAKRKRLTPNKFTDSLVASVTLCDSLRYCPSRVCPFHQRYKEQTIFFAGTVMHMAVVANNAILERVGHGKLVSAIQQLSILCVDEDLTPTRLLRSVIRGCSAKTSFFDRDGDSVMTHINYNTQSNSICVSIDVPAAVVCRTFIIRGIVAECFKSDEQACEDYSGSRCSKPGEHKGEFTLGPFHVVPVAISSETKIDSTVKYLHESFESTTQTPGHATSTVTGVEATEYITVVRDRITTTSETTKTPEVDLTSRNVLDIRMLDEATTIVESPALEATTYRGDNEINLDAVTNTSNENPSSNEKPTSAIRRIDVPRSKSFDVPIGFDIIDVDSNLDSTTFGYDLESPEDAAISDTETMFHMESGYGSTPEFDIGSSHAITNGPLSVYDMEDEHILRLNDLLEWLDSGDESSVYNSDYDGGSSVNTANAPAIPASPNPANDVVVAREYLLEKGPMDMNASKISVEMLDSGTHSADGTPSQQRDVLPKSGIRNVQRTESTSWALHPIGTSYNRSSRSSSEGEPYGTTTTVERHDDKENIDILESANNQAQEYRSPLRYFDIDEANEAFVWAGVSALGVFLLCSIALATAWTVNRKNAGKRRREWTEISSRL